MHYRLRPSHHRAVLGEVKICKLGADSLYTALKKYSRLGRRLPQTEHYADGEHACDTRCGPLHDHRPIRRAPISWENGTGSSATAGRTLAPPSSSAYPYARAGGGVSVWTPAAAKPRSAGHRRPGR